MDRIKQLHEALKASQKNGWVFTASGMAVRVTTHETPESIMAGGHWQGATYTAVEALDFTFTQCNRVPITVYKTTTCPWVTRLDQKISYRRGLELLAQPLAESLFHRR